MGWSGECYTCRCQTGYSLSGNGMVDIVVVGDKVEWLVLCGTYVFVF